MRTSLHIPENDERSTWQSPLSVPEGSTAFALGSKVREIVSRHRFPDGDALDDLAAAGVLLDRWRRFGWSGVRRDCWSRRLHPRRFWRRRRDVQRGEPVAGDVDELAVRK